ncbi:sigma-70 family RNA polymerase sigma factor [Streptomyces sp. NPDC048392]|uniref:sigma-70 family RNA polymerase sigma factor n=1 Tax=Streptomyces sp. NPDC048392 TaxID=3365543 RepID=UPI00371D25C6
MSLRTHRGAAPLQPSPEDLDALLLELARRPPGPERAALRERVIRLLLPMARRVARRFHRYGEDPDDLVQVASLGLIKAVDAYDPTLGHAFLSYALPKVTGELRRHLRDRTATVRLPRALQEASGQVVRAVEELEQRFHGHSPTPEQIAEHTGLDPALVRATVRALHESRPRSLDEPAARDHEDPLSCLLGAEDTGYGRVVDTVALAALVEQLPERDRHVLHLRFYRERTQQQIADVIGVSQMQVSRILRRCLDRLREGLLTNEPPRDGAPVQRPRGLRDSDAARPTRPRGGGRHRAEPARPGSSVTPPPHTAPAAAATAEAGPARQAARRSSPVARCRGAVGCAAAGPGRDVVRRSVRALPMPMPTCRTPPRLAVLSPRPDRARAGPAGQPQATGRPRRRTLAPSRERPARPPPDARGAEGTTGTVQKEGPVTTHAARASTGSRGGHP